MFVFLSSFRHRKVPQSHSEADVSHGFRIRSIWEGAGLWLEGLTSSFLTPGTSFPSWTSCMTSANDSRVPSAGGCAAWSSLSPGCESVALSVAFALSELCCLYLLGSMGSTNLTMRRDDNTRVQVRTSSPLTLISWSPGAFRTWGALSPHKTLIWLHTCVYLTRLD